MSNLIAYKLGYKHTELGWIPEEWKIYTLDQLGTFSKGKGILKEQLTHRV